MMIIYKNLLICMLSFLCTGSILDQQIEIRLNVKIPQTNGIEQITIKNKAETIKILYSNKEGVFQFPRSILKESKNYDIFLTSIGTTGMYLITLTISSPDKIEITLPKDYQMRFGRAVCPKCGKIKDVYKIKHSEAPIMTRQIIKGDTSYSPIYKRFYYMGDVYSNLDPKWYCDHDDIFF